MEPTVSLVGAAAEVELTVSLADTALALGSGEVPVLGTPRVLGLAEAASVAATAGRLPDGATTVGVAVQLEHLAATPVGRIVSASARVRSVEGRRIRFDFQILDGTTVVARGTLDRAMVDRERFLGRLGDPG